MSSALAKVRSSRVSDFVVNRLKYSDRQLDLNQILVEGEKISNIFSKDFVLEETSQAKIVKCKKIIFTKVDKTTLRKSILPFAKTLLADVKKVKITEEEVEDDVEFFEMYREILANCPKLEWLDFYGVSKFLKIGLASIDSEAISANGIDCFKINFRSHEVMDSELADILLEKFPNFKLHISFDSRNISIKSALSLEKVIYFFKNRRMNTITRIDGAFNQHNLDDCVQEMKSAFPNLVESRDHFFCEVNFENLGCNNLLSITNYEHFLCHLFHIVSIGQDYSSSVS